MPISLSSIRYWAESRIQSFADVTLSNPLIASLFLAFVVVLIVAVVFRDGDFKKNRLYKLFRLFIYVLVAMVALLFVQNNTILKHASVSGGMASISSAINQSEVNKTRDDYVTIDSPINPIPSVPSAPTQVVIIQPGSTPVHSRSVMPIAPPAPSS